MNAKKKNDNKSILLVEPQFINGMVNHNLLSVINSDLCRFNLNLESMTRIHLYLREKCLESTMVTSAHSPTPPSDILHSLALSLIIKIFKQRLLPEINFG